jgi:hypothetical protein
MEMFLMVLCVSLLGLALSAAAFGAATRDVDGAAANQVPLEPRLELAPPQFFVAGVPDRMALAPRVPIEVLLAQIERHVRMEQAAAESFIGFPSVESLHQRTASPLYN